MIKRPQAAIANGPAVITAVVILLYGCVLCGPQASGSEITALEAKLWDKLYNELHPGETPKWTELGGHRVWAERELGRLEPIVVEILQGKRAGIPSQHGLLVARCIPSPAICDVLYGRLNGAFQDIKAERRAWTSMDCASFEGVIAILADGNDSRAVGVLNELIQVSACSQRSILKYVRALRNIGTAETVDVLRQIPLRKTDERVDREAGLTEKIIEARLKGLSVSPNAQQELRTVARAFIHAVEMKDYKNFVSLFPYGFHETVDQSEVSKEFFENATFLATVSALKSAMEKPFEIAGNGLEAVLIFGDKCELKCILEVDGWKVANLR